MQRQQGSWAGRGLLDGWAGWDGSQRGQRRGSRDPLSALSDSQSCLSAIRERWLCWDVRGIHVFVWGHPGEQSGGPLAVITQGCAHLRGWIPALPLLLVTSWARPVTSLPCPLIGEMERMPCPQSSRSGKRDAWVAGHAWHSGLLPVPYPGSLPLPLLHLQLSLQRHRITTVRPTLKEEELRAR